MLWIRRHTHRFAPPASNTRRRQLVFVLATVVAAAACAASASAEWVGNSGYLWNTSAPFSLTVESHADAAWTQRLAQSAADWSTSGIVFVSVANKGKVALYDGYYGTNQPCAWTQFWQHGGNLSHDAIYVNETCLAGWSDYWKQYAICQELGHALGLPDHNTTPSVSSCMAPGLSAISPSTDDFAELALLYGTTTTTSSGKGGGKSSTPLSGGTWTSTAAPNDATKNPGYGNAASPSSASESSQGSRSQRPHP
jgi:hypothetical protein